VKISEIIYQFNFNDIVPEAYSRANLHKNIEPKDQSNIDINSQDSTVKQPSWGDTTESVKETEESKVNNDINIQYSTWFKVFARWRSEFLNYSVFLRTAQHYAGMIIRKKSGTCEERGLDALGPYTWTLGSRKYSEESALLWQIFMMITDCP